MGIPARQSTARTVIIGPVLDSSGAAVTDGVVGDFKVSKNGAAPAALNGSATLTHRHTGHYSLALTASDLDTVGTAQVTIDDTTNTCGRVDLDVIEEPVYDALFAASANAFTGAAGSSALTALASGAITEASFATTAGSFIPLGILDQGTAQSATSTTVRLRAGATFAADDIKDSIILVKGSDQDRWQTGRICTDYDAGTKDATVDPAFTTPPTGTISYIVVAGAADLTAPPEVQLADGVTHGGTTAMLRLGSTSTTPAFHVTNSAGPAVRFHATAGSFAGLQCWSEELHGLQALGSLTSGSGYGISAGHTAGSGSIYAGQGITGDLSGAVGSVTGAVGSVTGNVGGNVTGSVGSVTGAVGSVTGNVGGNVAGSVGSVAAGGITASSLAADAGQEIADAVWDEALAGHVSAGSTGEALNAAGGAGDPWITSLPGSYTAGQAGHILGTNLNATVSSRASQTTADAIVADTNELQTDWADGGRLDLLLDAVLADTGTDGVVLSSSTLNAIADALLDRTAGVETNRTPRQALRLILAAAAGKSSSATGTRTFRDTNDSVDRIVATVDEGDRTAVTLNAG